MWSLLIFIRDREVKRKLVQNKNSLYVFSVITENVLFVVELLAPLLQSSNYNNDDQDNEYMVAIYGEPMPST